MTTVLHIDYGPPIERGAKLLTMLAALPDQPGVVCLPALRVIADDSEGHCTGTLRSVSLEFETGGIILRLLDLPGNKPYFEATGFKPGDEVDLSLWCVDETIEVAGWVGTLSESELLAAEQATKTENAINDAASSLHRNGEDSQ